MSDSLGIHLNLVPDRTPPLERSRRRWSLGCIFIVQTLHGVAFYAMSSSLMAIAKTHLDFSNTAAVGTSLAFSACVYVMPSVGGTVGDIKLGRYNAIFYGTAIYLLGTVFSLVLVGLLHVAETTPIDVLPMRIVYLSSLILVAVSRGFIKTNLIPFGAQQVDQSKTFHITSYFRWSIWFFNIGKFCAYCPLAFIVLKVGEIDGLLIQAIVQVVTVALSVVVFILGKRKYTVSQPSEGRASIQYLWEVFRSSMLCFKKRQPWNEDTSWTESTSTVTPEQKAVTRIVFKKACFMLGIFASIGVFETLYFQMTSTYTMQRRSLRHDMQILPKHLMNSFAPCVVLLGVPLTELVSRKCWSMQRRKYKFTELVQIGSGTIFAALSVLCAGIIETQIRTGRDVSVFWQVPQFTLMGMSDLLVFIPDALPITRGEMLTLYLFIVAVVVMLVQGLALTSDPTDINFTDQDNASSTHDPTAESTLSYPSAAKPAPTPLKCNPQRFFNPNYPDSLYWQFMIYFDFSYYRWAILFPIAFVGNGIAFLGNVKRCRSSSPHFYMTVLSIVDLVFLAFAESYEPLLRNGVSFGTVGCKIFIFLTESFSVLSIWIIVFVTIERVIVVRFPLKASVMCTWSRAVKNTCALILVVMLLNIHVLVAITHYPPTPEFRLPRCVLDKTTFYDIWQFDVVFKSIVMSYIPIAVLFFCNIIIIATVRTSSALKKDMAGGERSQASNNQGNQITLMLLLVSITFVVLTVPPMIIRRINGEVVSTTAFAVYTCEEFFSRVIADTAKSYLHRLNSCINGYLYCMSSARFRKDLIAMICPCRRGKMVKTTVGANTAMTKISTISSKEKD